MLDIIMARLEKLEKAVEELRGERAAQEAKSEKNVTPNKVIADKTASAKTTT